MGQGHAEGAATDDGDATRTAQAAAEEFHVLPGAHGEDLGCIAPAERRQLGQGPGGEDQMVIGEGPAGAAAQQAAVAVDGDDALIEVDGDATALVPGGIDGTGCFRSVALQATDQGPAIQVAQTFFTEEGHLDPRPETPTQRRGGGMPGHAGTDDADAAHMPCSPCTAHAIGWDRMGPPDAKTGWKQGLGPCSLPRTSLTGSVAALTAAAIYCCDRVHRLMGCFGFEQKPLDLVQIAASCG